MMTILLSLALAATSGDSAGSVAGTTTTQTAKPAKAKKVCQRIESTGSSVPKKICRTVEAPKVEADAANTTAEKPTGNSTN